MSISTPIERQTCLAIINIDKNLDSIRRLQQLQADSLERIAKCLENNKA